MTTLEILAARYGLTLPVPPPYPREIPRVNREDLPGLFTACGFTKGAEIGVWEGEHAAQLCRGIPGLHLYAVDPWQVYDAYRDHRRQTRMNESYEKAKAALAPFHVTFLRTFSADAARLIPDRSLDFVYLDGNHRYESVVEDLARWTPKVRSGGIVSGHDYAEMAPRLMCHVMQAVGGWTSAYQVAPWFVLGRGRDARKFHGGSPHAYRSFLWVQP